MADLCGPSNALQSFQKHSQVDRTLQQDRLRGPTHSPAQGFRTPDPRAGSLDAEFAAFEAGSTNPALFEQSLSSHIPHGPHFLPHSSDWTSEFQNLHLSNHPIPSQQFHIEAPLVRSAPNGWQSEFMSQRQNVNNTVAYGKQVDRSQSMLGHGHGQSAHQSTLHNPWATATSAAYSGMVGAANYPTYSDHFHQPVYDGQMQLSEADFEQAFADAFENAESMDLSENAKASAQSTDQSDMLHQDGTYTNDHSLSSELVNHDTPQEMTDIRIGSDAIPYTDSQERQNMTTEQNSAEADELARTAGQLLNAVSHDTSSKFQGSQFLALMRKIRDREVEVKNEEFQETGQSKTVGAGGNAQVPSGSTSFNTQTQPSMTDLRPHDPNSFQFPDLNNVYRPEAEVGLSSSRMPSRLYGEEGYNTDSWPENQPLHPGGSLYPEQSPPPSTQHAEMSGGISAEDFERHDENVGLANRYQKPSIEDVGENATTA